MDRIGFMVKRYRIKQRLTRKEFCALCDVSPSYLSEIERGIKNNFNTCLLIEFCKTLNVTPNDLIPEELYKGDKNEKRTTTRGNDS